jgi:hypothetical protein
MSTELATISAEDARALTDRIKVGMDGIWELIKDAYQYRAWAALGYTGWDDYCNREFGTQRIKLPREERREIVSSMREIGMSARAISIATGADRKTIATDLKSGGGNSATSGKVIGADGKEYPAARPQEKPEPVPEHDDNGIVEVACNICDRFFPIQETYEAIGGGFECEDCVNGPAESEPSQPAPPADDRRQPLAPAFLRKAFELKKAAESLRKKVDDDRFDYNSASVSRDNLPELIRARQDLEYVIAALQVSWKGGES